jgi:hypothetical protein
MNINKKTNDYKCPQCENDLIMMNTMSYYDYGIEDCDGYVEEYKCSIGIDCNLDKILIYILEDNAEV